MKLKTYLNFGGNCADIPSYQPMRSAYISLGLGSDGEADRIFAALSNGGEIFVPMPRQA
jgi:PhnB protein